MVKVVKIGEERLASLKERLMGEAAPEVDEYEIVDDGSNPPLGGNYYHVKENIEFEVEPSDVDVSSIKANDSLEHGIWGADGKLNPRVRLTLLDISDDFWNSVGISWVRPKKTILVGSICNYNYYEGSDIDLHLVVDFSEIDEKTEFVRRYLDSKKNDWNNSHELLTILGHQVEVYVQDVSDEVQSGGAYDLDEDDWIARPSEPSPSLGIDKSMVKDKAAMVMTIIDGMESLLTRGNGPMVQVIGDDAKRLSAALKTRRRASLQTDGELGTWNLVYKILRRSNYLDKLRSIIERSYDKSMSIGELETPTMSESVINGVKQIISEEFVADGNSEHNPYAKRWREERQALKDFICNYGQVMQSKENGKLYKVYFDQTLSQMIGYNYCVCIQWDQYEMKPKSIVYIRAYDKFTPNIKQVSYDDRGRDNMRGTYDDVNGNY